MQSPRGVKSLLVAALVCGCATAQTPRATCDGWSSLSRASAPPRVGLQKRPPVFIETVRVSGVDSRLAEMLRLQLATKPGAVLDDAPIADDLRRLWTLGVIDDARVEVEGGNVMFVVAPRRPITNVVHHGGDKLAQSRFRQLEAASFEPSRIHRMAEALRESYVREGRLDATVEARHRVHATGVEVCVATNPGPKITIAKLEFPGSKAIPKKQLVEAMHGSDAHVNRVGGSWDEDALQYDNLYLLAAYYEVGHLDAQIRAPIVKRRGNRLQVAIPIDEGPRYRLGEIDAPIPVALRTGDVVQRSKIIETVEMLRKKLGAYDVVPVTSIDKDARRLDIRFEIEWRWPWDARRFWLSQSR